MLGGGVGGCGRKNNNIVLEQIQKGNMKRREFGWLGAVSAAAMVAGLGLPARGRAALRQADADRLKGELTPVGAERAGNADGSIPAWTGDALPLQGAGPWGLMPDFFADDAKIISIDAGNMAQYAGRLSEGMKLMLSTCQDFRMDVFPTHRTAIATQEVYDNAYINVTSTTAASGGSRLGFSGAFGAIPFPIPDPSDPLEAGAQVIWNHSCRWFGAYQTRNLSTWTMIDGQLVLATGYKTQQACPYYYPNGNRQTYDGDLRLFRVMNLGPPQDKGQAYLEINTTNPLTNPTKIWEYLVGQGRVRRAPELQYDTPETQSTDIINYDETYLFYGAQNQYDWKLIGKREVYIPYNNNKLFLQTPQSAMLPQFVNPDFVRWELHRVWVVEATLHPGERNVLARRRFYVDEDSWTIALYEAYDAKGRIVRVGNCMFEVRPDIPATIFGSGVHYNVYAGEYVVEDGPWNVTPYDEPYLMTPIPDSRFNPQSLATNSQY